MGCYLKINVTLGRLKQSPGIEEELFVHIFMTLLESHVSICYVEKDVKNKMDIKRVLKQTKKLVKIHQVQDTREALAIDSV